MVHLYQFGHTVRIVFCITAVMKGLLATNDWFLLQCIYYETCGEYGKLAEYQKQTLEEDEQNDTLFKRQVFRAEHYYAAPCSSQRHMCAELSLATGMSKHC